MQINKSDVISFGLFIALAMIPLGMYLMWDAQQQIINEHTIQIEELNNQLEQNETLDDETFAILAEQTAELELQIKHLDTVVEILCNKEPEKLYIPAEVYAYDDLVYAARLVAAEARGCSEETQLGVAQVIWDRLHCTTYNFGSSIREVIDSPGQFTNVWMGDLNSVPFCLEAVIQVFYGGYRQFEQNTYYFYNPNTASAHSLGWFRQLPLVADYGDTVFRGMR